MSRFHMILALAVGVSPLLGCSKTPPDTGASPAAPTAATPVSTTPTVPYVSQTEAQKVFVGRCASCHGMKGKGDGPGSAALNPKPRDYTNKAWQNTVSDEQIGKTILYGGAAVGKSPAMPSNPDLDSKPQMVAALVKVVRSFGQ